MLHGSHEFPQSLSHEIFNKTAKISRTGLTSCRFSDVENSDLSRWFPLLGGRSSPNWPHKHFSLLCRHSVHTRLTVSSASFDSFGCTIVSSPAVQPGMVPKLPIWSGTARMGSTRGRFTRHAFMTYTRGPAYRRRAMRRGAREHVLDHRRRRRRHLHRLLHARRGERRGAHRQEALDPRQPRPGDRRRAARAGLPARDRPRRAAAAVPRHDRGHQRAHPAPRG